MELAELFEQIATHDPKAFAAALQDASQPHFQAIFNQGHSAATAKKNDEVKALTEQLEALTRERDDYGRTIEELKQKQPKFDELQAETERKLREKATQHEQALTRLRESVIGTERGRHRMGIVNALIAAGADEWTAERAVDSRTMDRVNVFLNAEDKPGVKFYERDGDTPLALAEGQNPYDFIARDVIQQMPEHLRPRQGQRGSNLGAGPSTNGSLTLTRSQFDALSVLDRHAFMAKPGAQVVDG